MSGQISAAGDSLLQQLSERIAAPVSAQLRARASWHLLDWLGCAVGGCNLSSASSFRRLAETGANGPASTLSMGRKSWRDALEFNAAIGNLLEMDDVHRSSILHPGPIIIPAAIAVAELQSASAEQLLSAIVRGYEVTIRIGAALGLSHYRHYHSTSSCGAFGAAAAAASLLALDSTTTAHALANAGSRTGGLWQLRHHRCHTKSLHNVQAAQTGVQAALLAALGACGPLDLLEGDQGLFVATAADSDPRGVLEALESTDWQISQVSFKPWPACRHAHPAIDAVRALRGQLSSAAVPTQLDIHTYSAALDFCNCPNPTDAMQARFSLQHSAAVAWLREEPRLTDFDATTLDDPQIAHLRSRVQVHNDAQLSASFPQHYAARVIARAANGETFQHAVSDAYGDPDWPLDLSALKRKASMLMKHGGVADPTLLIESTLGLANEPVAVQDWTSLWP